MGTSAPVTRCTGASRRSKASPSIRSAQISAPTPLCGQPSSTVTQRLVLMTDFTTVSVSKGRMHRRLITSTSYPSLESSSAARKHKPTERDIVTKVISLPSRSILAFPKGMVKSLDRASSLTSNSVLYSISCSSTTTGLGSRIAALIMPRASSALYGMNTLRPGTEPYQAAKHWECCAPTPAAAPLGPRKVIGALMVPRVMLRFLAAELII
mmetsp:Transcript_17914/g.31662  ORF Transcript_17914/g.31662 Transcript_17914/m.31662 type:complete len:211 (+) Transcript_17914:326-958(+)